MEESRRNGHLHSATLLFSPFVKQTPLFCFTAPVHQTNGFQDFSTTISRAQLQHSILDGFSSAHTYSPSWLLSFPSYCTIRMTRGDLLHCRRIPNNPERRWHSQLWMGPVQTPLSCWKDKLRSDWCGGFQQGMIKNKIKTGGEKVFWRYILRREGQQFWGSIKNPKPVPKQRMEWEKPSEAGKATVGLVHSSWDPAAEILHLFQSATKSCGYGISLGFLIC